MNAWVKRPIAFVLTVMMCVSLTPVFSMASTDYKVILESSTETVTENEPFTLDVVLNGPAGGIAPAAASVKLTYSGAAYEGGSTSITDARVTSSGSECVVSYYDNTTARFDADGRLKLATFTFKAGTSDSTFTVTEAVATEPESAAAAAVSLPANSTKVEVNIPEYSLELDYPSSCAAGDRFELKLYLTGPANARIPAKIDVNIGVPYDEHKINMSVETFTPAYTSPSFFDRNKNELMLGYYDLDGSFDENGKYHLLSCMIVCQEGSTSGDFTIKNASVNGKSIVEAGTTYPIVVSGEIEVPTPTLKLGEVIAPRGGTTTVPLYYTDIEEDISFANVYYDSELALEDVTAESGCKVHSYDSEKGIIALSLTKSEIANNGLIANLTFRVPKDAEMGAVYPITFNESSSVNTKAEEYISGSVTVTDGYVVTFDSTALSVVSVDGKEREYIGVGSGETLKFRVEPRYTNTEILSVKTDDDVLTPTEGIYSINNIQKDITVTVEARQINQQGDLVISNAEEMKAFADRVNAGETFEGQLVTLAADIDLSDYPQWEPIGGTKPNNESTSSTSCWFGDKETEISGTGELFTASFNLGDVNPGTYSLTVTGSYIMGSEKAFTPATLTFAVGEENSDEPATVNSGPFRFVTEVNGSTVSVTVSVDENPGTLTYGMVDFGYTVSDFILYNPSVSRGAVLKNAGVWVDNRMNYSFFVTRSFNGTFDGCDHSITLAIDNDYGYRTDIPAEELYASGYRPQAGLFGRIEGAQIQNLKTQGTFQVRNTSYAAPICAYAVDSSILFCENYADIPHPSGLGWLAGIAAHMHTTDNDPSKLVLYRCMNAGNIVASMTDIGEYVRNISGICAEATGVVKECGNIGDITTKSTAIQHSNSDLGDHLVAANQAVSGIALNANTAIACYNKGNISATSYSIYGITNQNAIDCYNTGNLTSDMFGTKGQRVQIGGIGNGRCTNCYSIGTLAATNTSGTEYSFTGDIVPANCLITPVNCYSSVDTITTEKLGDAYRDDINNVNGGYPLLYWQSDEIGDETYAVTITTEPSSAVTTVYSDAEMTQIVEKGSDGYMLKPGVYYYSVQADGYLKETGSLSVTVKPVNTTVILKKASTVSFRVSPEDADLTVEYNGLPVKPESQDKGVYVYSFYTGGTYTYKALKEGYNSIMRDYVASGDTTVDVTLTASAWGEDPDSFIYGDGNQGKPHEITKGGVYSIGDGATGIMTIDTKEPVTLIGRGTASESVYKKLYIDCKQPGTDLTLKDVFIKTDTQNETADPKMTNMFNYTGKGNHLRFAGLNMLDQNTNASGYAMVHVNQDTELTVGGVTEDDELYFYKREQGAGIGGNGGASGGEGQEPETNGKITITGGRLFMKNSKQGALIGAGAQAGTRVPGDIIIEGGVLNLIAISRSAAIGGSAGSSGASSGSNVYVRGGTININVDYSGSAIGGGGYDPEKVDDNQISNKPDGGTLYYLAGSIRTFIDQNAIGAWQVESPGIYQNKAITASVKDEDGKALYLLELDTNQLQPSEEGHYTVKEGSRTVYDGGLHQYTYVNEALPKEQQITINNTMDNWTALQEPNLYLYFTGKNHTLEVNGQIVNVYWDEESETFTMEVEETEVDKTALNSLVDSAAAELQRTVTSTQENSTALTPDTVWATQEAKQELQNAIDAAGTVSRKEDATQEAVDAEVTALTKALANFRKAQTTVTAANVDDLKTAISAAQSKLANTIPSQDGTDVQKDQQWAAPEKRNDVLAAIEAAEAVVKDASRKSQKEADEALASLNAAVANLNPQYGTKEDPVPVNRDDLVNAITAAQEDLRTAVSSENGTDIATDKKWVDEATAQALKDALQAADAVKNNTEATQEQIDQAAANLKKAIETFDSKKKNGVPADRSVLQQALKKAEDLLTGTMDSPAGDGSDVSADQQWAPQDAKTALKAAVDEAKKADQDLVAQSKVDGAAKTLNDAIAAFEAKRSSGTKPQAPLVDKTELQSAITAAQSDRSLTEVSEENGTDVDPAKQWVTPAAAGALDDAVAVAQAVATDGSATQSRVNQAVADLQAAQKIFDDAKQNGKPADRKDLQAAMVKARELLNNTRVSADGSEISPSEQWTTEAERNSLTQAIDAAALSDKDGVVQSKVDAAAKNLKDAAAVFEKARQAGTHEDAILLNRDSLTKAIDEAQEDCDGTKVSDENGTDVDTGKKWVDAKTAADLRTAIKAAQDTLAKAGSQEELDAAETALKEAVKIFDKAKKNGVPADRKALQDALAKAQQLLKETGVSADGRDVKPGTPWAEKSVCDALSQAVAAAQASDQDNLPQSKVDAAAKSLNDAVTAFEASRKTADPTDKSALGQLLADAEAAQKDTAVSSNGGDVVPGKQWVSRSVSDALSSKVDPAKAVMEQADATQKEIDDAKAKLQTALEVFNSAKKTAEAPNTDALQSAISAAEQKLDATVASADGQDIPKTQRWAKEEDRATLSQAVDAAKAVLAAAAGKTQNEVDSAAQAMNDAAKAFHPMFGQKEEVTDENLVTGQVSDAVKWDGVDVDVSWYFGHENDTSFTIDTAAKLAGVAALVNGLVNKDSHVYISDTQYYPAEWWNDMDHGYVLGSDEEERAGSQNKATAAYHYGIESFKGKTLVLAKDLDMGGQQDADGEWFGPAYMPIGGQYLMTKNDTATKLSSSFCGTFDGGGHTVSNIFCDRHCETGNYGDGQSVGFIGRMGAHDSDPADLRPTDPTVKDLAVSGYIYGNRSVGGIVGKTGKTTANSGDGSTGSIISGCVNYATVQNTDAKGCGGICGAFWNGGRMENCYNAGDVTTTYACPTAGLAGSNENAIINSYNCGTVSAPNGNYAMALGTNNGGAPARVITNCWYLDGSAPGGGYYSANTADNSGAMSSEDMKKDAFVTQLGEAFAVDSGKINNGYPILKWQGGTEPVTPEQPSVDKTALKALIENADKETDEAVISTAEDAKALKPGAVWTTQAEKKALQDAVAAAKAVYDNEDATADDVAAQEKALSEALAKFRDAKKTVKAADADQLKQAVDAAREKLNQTLESGDGSNVPKDQQWAKPEDRKALSDAITAADAVAKAAAEKSQNEVDAALADLEKAVNAFQPQDGKKEDAVPVNREELTKALTDAQKLLSDTPVSTENGNDVDPANQWVDQDAADRLSEAIAAAQAVAAKADATQAEVDAAKKALDDAVAAFNEAKKPGTKEDTPEPPVVEKGALNDAIEAAQGTQSEAAGSADGSDVDPLGQWVPQNVAKALDDAIKAAQAVADDPDATQDDVDAAKAALDKAVADFNEAKKPGTKPEATDELDRVPLYEAIVDAKRDLENTKISADGNDVDPADQWVHQGAANVLKRYLAEALNAAVMATTQPQLDEAAQSLRDAMDTFDSAKRNGTKPEPVPADKAALTDAVKAAQNDLAGVKVSESGADVPKTEKWVPQSAADVLKEAIDAAQAVAAKDDPAQEEVDQAVKALQDAVSAFDAQKKDGTKSSGSSGGSGGSSGGSSGGITPSNPSAGQKDRVITVTPKEHGNVSTPKNAKAGQTVTIEVKPDEGYTVDQVVVKDASGNPVEVKDLGNGKYSYTQPESDVTVDVSYKEEEPAGPGPDDHEAVCPSRAFRDLDTSLWYHEAIDSVLTKDYFNGVGNGMFEPNGSMTRAMFVTVLGRVAGVDVSKYTETPFADAPAGQWYTPYVAWASENAIVLGYDRETFGPSDPVTREQMAAILYRYAKYAGVDVTAVDATKFHAFADADQVSDYAKAPMIWATDKGLINGMGDGTLAPQAESTRAQVAQLIMNFDKFIG